MGLRFDNDGAKAKWSGKRKLDEAGKRGRLVTMPGMSKYKKEFNYHKPEALVRDLSQHSSRSRGKLQLSKPPSC